VYTASLESISRTTISRDGPIRNRWSGSYRWPNSSPDSPTDAGDCQRTIYRIRRLPYEAPTLGFGAPNSPQASGVSRGAETGCPAWELADWEEALCLWHLPGTETLKGKRDRALLAVLLVCGLRRRELPGRVINVNSWHVVQLAVTLSTLYLCCGISHLRWGPDLPPLNNSADAREMRPENVVNGTISVAARPYLRQAAVGRKT
jgi:hypothetical protein